jgi:hypothetical protein
VTYIATVNISGTHLHVEYSEGGPYSVLYNGSITPSAQPRGAYVEMESGGNTIRHFGVQVTAG